MEILTASLMSILSYTVKEFNLSAKSKEWANWKAKERWYWHRCDLFWLTAMTQVSSKPSTSLTQTPTRKSSSNQFSALTTGKESVCRFLTHFQAKSPSKFGSWKEAAPDSMESTDLLSNKFATTDLNNSSLKTSKTLHLCSNLLSSILVIPQSFTCNSQLCNLCNPYQCNNLVLSSIQEVYRLEELLSNHNSKQPNLSIRELKWHLRWISSRWCRCSSSKWWCSSSRCNSHSKWVSQWWCSNNRWWANLLWCSLNRCNNSQWTINNSSDRDLTSN